MRIEQAIEVSAKRVNADSEFFAVCYDWKIPGDSKLFQTREEALAEALLIVEAANYDAGFVYRP